MKKKWICGILALCLLIGLLPAMKLPVFAVTEMTVSQELIEVVKKLEGFEPYPYWDYSQYTVGYGSRCPDDKYEEYKKNGIPEAEAEALLLADMARYEAEINAYARKYDLRFTQNEFDALVSLSFNCGPGWTYETNGILNQAIRSGATGNDLIYAMSLYSKAHTDYLLIKRRLTEANMYLNGVYKAYNRDPGAYPDTYKYVFLDGNGGEVTYAIHGYDAAAAAPVKTSFKTVPTGVDENGNAFVYTFAGWYTAPNGGEKVEVLDGTLESAAVLYARWADPSGELVELPKGDLVSNVLISITADKANIRSGPGSYYPKLGTLTRGSEVIITQTYTTNGALWGKFDGGWISLSNTNFSDAVIEQAPEPTWPKEGAVNGSDVNVRSGPGTDNDVQYQLNVGDPVVIHESYHDGELLWGRLDDGNWICLTYVTFNEEEAPPEPEKTVTGIVLLSAPARTEYVQMQDFLELNGSILQISYSDGTCEAMTLTYPMISDYSNAQLGETTVTVCYEGFEVTFPVTIVMATVTFRNYDGTVISQTQYAYGDEIQIPEPAMKPADEAGEYEFIGWDKEVIPCWGNEVYTALFRLKQEELPAPDYIPGDFDGSGTVDENDADYLLGYLLFPEWYPIAIPADLDGSGTVDENDADYLLGYLLFPEWYPISVP